MTTDILRLPAELEQDLVQDSIIVHVPEHWSFDGWRVWRFLERVAAALRAEFPDAYIDVLPGCGDHEDPVSVLVEGAIDPEVVHAIIDDVPF